MSDIDSQIQADLGELDMSPFIDDIVREVEEFICYLKNSRTQGRDCADDIVIRKVHHGSYSCCSVRGWADNMRRKLYQAIDMCQVSEGDEDHLMHLDIVLEMEMNKVNLRGFISQRH